MELFQNIDIKYFWLILMPFGRHYFKYDYIVIGCCYCLFVFKFIGRCFNQWLVADVMPLGLMLLPYVYSLITMADVIAIFVADVVTTFYLCYYIWLVLLPYMCGQMLLPLRLMLLPTISVFHGWCYCQEGGRCYCYLGWCYCLPYL